MQYAPAAGFRLWRLGARRIPRAIVGLDPGSLWSRLRYFVLPGSALAFALMAINARLIRSSMIETCARTSSSSRAPRACPRRVIYLRHALRNAIIPVVTVVGLQIGAPSGAIVVETVFAWPGIGRLAVQAVSLARLSRRPGGGADLGEFSSSSTSIVDLLYRVIDPRMRHG